MKLINSMLRFLWRRDSESASILAITLSWYMEDYDLRDMSEYCQSMREFKKHMEEQGGK